MLQYDSLPAEELRSVDYGRDPAVSIRIADPLVSSLSQGVHFGAHAVNITFGCSVRSGMGAAPAFASNAVLGFLTAAAAALPSGAASPFQADPSATKKPLFAPGNLLGTSSTGSPSIAFGGAPPPVPTGFGRPLATRATPFVVGAAAAGTASNDMGNFFRLGAPTPVSSFGTVIPATDNTFASATSPFGTPVDPSTSLTAGTFLLPNAPQQPTPCRRLIDPPEVCNIYFVELGLREDT